MIPAAADAPIPDTASPLDALPEACGSRWTSHSAATSTRSTLDQDVRSPVGAIGVMQVMPPTSKDLNVGDITEVEANIHAGVKYMR